MANETTVFCTQCPIRLLCYDEDEPPEDNSTDKNCILAKLYKSELIVETRGYVTTRD